MISRNVIGTGSSGNAVQVNKEILMDCGVPYKLLEPIRRDLSLVLLTHRHGDHFRETAVRRLAEERPTLRWGMCDWMLPLAKDCINYRNIDIMLPDRRYDYGAFSVTPFALLHDVPNCGYLIQMKSGERIFYATDTGTLDGVSAPDCNLYLIEANHDREELEQRAREKIERGEFSYEYRAAMTHLSRQQAEDWLVKNARPYSQIVYLHQHKEASAKGKR